MFFYMNRHKKKCSQVREKSSTRPINVKTRVRMRNDHAMRWCSENVNVESDKYFDVMTYTERKVDKNAGFEIH